MRSTKQLRIFDVHFHENISPIRVKAEGFSDAADEALYQLAHKTDCAVLRGKSAISKIEIFDPIKHYWSKK